MNSAKIQPVALKTFTKDELHDKRLAFLAGKYLWCPPEQMHVEESFTEPGKYNVSITFVSVSSAKPGEDFGLIDSTKVSLGQAIVDKIETTEGDSGYKKYCKMAGCPFVVLADVFAQ